MRLTTLGTGSAAPSSRRVCSGNLVEAGDRRLLLDCGTGILHRMATLGLDWVSITDIAVTHFHADHVGDLAPYLIAARYGTLPPRSAPLRLVGPLGTRQLLQRLAELFGSTVTEPGFPLEVVELPPGARLKLGGGADLEPRAVPHTDESVAYSVECGNRRLVYTGDTGPDEGLGDWARDCDVLLAECSLPQEMAVPNHMTPEYCAALALRARPGTLVLTHFYPPVESVNIKAIIAGTFEGRVELASDGWVMEIEED